MAELRRGPITNRWVIIAKERSKRPSDFVSVREDSLGIEPVEVEVAPLAPPDCPFCMGNERMTPPEIYAVRENPQPNGPGWQIRVVPNKYPALVPGSDLGRAGIGFFDMMNGVGAHEVVIESPNHYADLTNLPLDHVKKVIDVYIGRMRDLMGDKRFRYILLFKDYGERAGASLSHPHAQIIATPVTPRAVRDRLRAAKEYYEQKERCIFCDVMIQEMALGDRIVDKTDNYLVWSPFDSRFPFEVHIFPCYHSHDFTTIDDPQREELARVLRRTLWRLKKLLNNPSYNLMVQTSPNPVPRPGKPGYWATLQYDYHWSIEIIPRLTRIAGFEWGTGFYINPTPPEEATKYLQQVQLPEEL